nr:hypothetical protein [Marinicella sp. W31]MDC2878652.1 hypothetical protein [Marinicella sp. W31]
MQENLDHRAPNQRGLSGFELKLSPTGHSASCISFLAASSRELHSPPVSIHDNLVAHVSRWKGNTIHRQLIAKEKQALALLELADIDGSVTSHMRPQPLQSGAPAW